MNGWMNAERIHNPTSSMESHQSTKKNKNFCYLFLGWRGDPPPGWSELAARLLHDQGGGGVLHHHQGEEERCLGSLHRNRRPGHWILDNIKRDPFRIRIHLIRIPYRYVSWSSIFLGWIPYRSGSVSGSWVLMTKICKKFIVKKN